MRVMIVAGVWTNDYCSRGFALRMPAKLRWRGLGVENGYGALKTRRNLSLRIISGWRIIRSR
jgi:hypothetical protein